MDPKQALQSFIETSIRAGQKKEDIMRILTGRGWDAESVNRVYDFVVNVSGSVATAAPAGKKPEEAKPAKNISTEPKEPLISMKLMVTTFVIVLVIGLIIAFIVAFVQKSNPKAGNPNAQASLPNMQPAQSKIASGTSAAPSDAPVTNPIESFAEAFQKSDFRIRGSGVLSRETKTSSMSGSTSLNFDKTVFYAKRGTIFRADIRDENRNDAYIIKGQQLITLDVIGKTYSQESATSEFGSFFKGILETSFVPVAMHRDSKKLTWKKQSDRIWETDYGVASPLDTSAIESHITITLDEQNLVSRMVFVVKGTKNEQVVSFAYEKLNDVEPFLTIPSGYRQKTIPG